MPEWRPPGGPADGAADPLRARRRGPHGGAGAGPRRTALAAGPHRPRDPVVVMAAATGHSPTSATSPASATASWPRRRSSPRSIWTSSVAWPAVPRAFTLAGGPGVAVHRLIALLSACVGLGLLGQEGEAYVNAPPPPPTSCAARPCTSATTFASRSLGSLPTLRHLELALAGERIDFYGKIKVPPRRVGSASPSTRARWGRRTWRAGLVDLAGCRTLLDVGGGSGAFSIALCRRHPELSATILDFPSVRPIAEEMVSRPG